LNKEYFNNQLKIKSVEYTTNQNSRFGCCNYRTAKILISHKIGLMPKWVRKYVLIHEMAHLIQPNHSRAFWDIVYRYKLTERARGYIMAASRVNLLD
jgi:predicted metal-dependent hydrolase